MHIFVASFANEICNVVVFFNELFMGKRKYVHQSTEFHILRQFLK